MVAALAVTVAGAGWVGVDHVPTGPRRRGLGQRLGPRRSDLLPGHHRHRTPTWGSGRPCPRASPAAGHGLRPVDPPSQPRLGNGGPGHGRPALYGTRGRRRGAGGQPRRPSPRHGTVRGRLHAAFELDRALHEGESHRLTIHFTYRDNGCSSGTIWIGNFPRLSVSALAVTTPWPAREPSHSREPAAHPVARIPTEPATLALTPRPAIGPPLPPFHSFAANRESAVVPMRVGG